MKKIVKRIFQPLLKGYHWIGWALFIAVSKIIQFAVRLYAWTKPKIAWAFAAMTGFFKKVFTAIINFGKFLVAFDDIQKDLGSTEAPVKQPGKSRIVIFLKKNRERITWISVALLILDRVEGKLGIFDFFADIALYWRIYTRAFWHWFFSLFDFPFKYNISTNEYDLLTLAAISFSAVMIPYLFKKFRLGKAARNESVWIWFRKNYRKKFPQNFVYILLPFLTLAVFFYAFSITNFTTLKASPQGKDHYVKEFYIWLTLTFLYLAIGVLALLASFAFKSGKNIRWYALGFILYTVLGRPFYHFWLVSFMPVTFWEYDNATRGIAVLTLAYIASFCAVAFVHNWQFFGKAVFWFLVLAVADLIVQVVSPWWMAIREAIEIKK